MAKPYFQVTHSFITQIGGREVAYQAGEIVPSDDPAVRKLPDHFTPLEVRGVAVEQATSAPGERRILRRSKPEPEAVVVPEPEPEPVAAGKAMTLAGMKGS